MLAVSSIIDEAVDAETCVISAMLVVYFHSGIDDCQTRLKKIVSELTSGGRSLLELTFSNRVANLGHATGIPVHGVHRQTALPGWHRPDPSFSAGLPGPKYCT